MRIIVGVNLVHGPRPRVDAMGQRQRSCQGRRAVRRSHHSVPPRRSPIYGGDKLTMRISEEEKAVLLDPQQVWDASAHMPVEAARVSRSPTRRFPQMSFIRLSRRRQTSSRRRRPRCRYPNTARHDRGRSHCDDHRGFGRPRTTCRNR